MAISKRGKVQPLMSQKGRRKVRLLDLNNLDGRTIVARSVRRMTKQMIDDLGGEESVTAMQRIVVQNISVLSAMIEDQAAKYCRGMEVDLSAYSALVAQQRRLLAEIGIIRPPDVTDPIDKFVSVQWSIVDPKHPENNVTATRVSQRTQGGGWTNHAVDGEADKPVIEVVHTIVDPPHEHARTIPAPAELPPGAMTFKLDRPT